MAISAQRPALHPVKPTSLGQFMPPTPSESPKEMSSIEHMQEPIADIHLNGCGSETTYDDESLEASYGGSHTQSWTWCSPRALQEDLYVLAKVSVERHFRAYDRNSLDALKSLERWCDHAVSMKMAEIKLERRRIEEKENFNRLHASNNNLAPKPFCGRKLSVGLGAVLCFHTLWCTDYKTRWRTLAPWPTIAEQKWEGEDRARTKVGRYFPLPREPGNGSIPWNYLPMVNPSPFDQIWKVPCELDILYPMHQLDVEVEEDKHMLLNSCVLDAVHPGPHDVWGTGDLSPDTL